ncbi:MAG: hypothetical protein WCH11_07125 [Bdellovibrio sp.]
MAQSENGKTLNKIKTSLWGRSLALAKITFNSGAGYAGHSLGSWLSSDEEKSKKWKDFLKII